MAEGSRPADQGSHRATADPDNQNEPRTSGVTAALLVAVLAFAVQQTAIVPAVHDVQVSLGSSQEWSSWLVTIYLMVATVATPGLGRLGDLYGRRRMLLLGLSVFALGSIGAAAAPDMVVLILARAVQGVGGAVYPLTLALARDHVRPERASRAIALLTGAFGAGTALGFAGGGVLAQYLSWRAIFALGAVLVSVAALLILRRVGAAQETAAGRYDLLGTAMMGASAITLLAGLTLVVTLGWSSAVTIALFVIAVAAAVAWVAHERRTEDPLIDLHVLRVRPVIVSNVATIAVGWCLFASYLLIPQFARAGGADGYGLGAGAAVTGFLMLPLAAGQTACGPLAGLLPVPPRALLATGLLLLAAATCWLAFVQHSGWDLAGAALLIGMGAGLGIQAASATVTRAVEPDVAAISAAVNSTVRRLAGGVGGQTSTLLLASLTLGAAPSFTAFRVAYLIAAGLAVLGAVGAAVTASPRG